MHINYLAVVVAAVAGFVLGWGWYSVFGKVWMAGSRQEQRRLRQAHAGRPAGHRRGRLSRHGLHARRADGPSRQCHASEAG